MGLVYHKERCPQNARLRAFVDWWDVSGPFPIVIVAGDRTDQEQLEDYRKGRGQLASGQWVVLDKSAVVTNARTAADSAHGHRAGIDCHPVREVYPGGGVKSVYLGSETDPAVRAQAVRRLEEYDRLAKEHGLETGELYPGICDRPHACDPEWRKLPLGPGVKPPN